MLSTQGLGASGKNPQLYNTLYIVLYIFFFFGFFQTHLAPVCGTWKGEKEIKKKLIRQIEID